MILGQLKRRVTCSCETDINLSRGKRYPNIYQIRYNIFFCEKLESIRQFATKKLCNWPNQIMSGQPTRRPARLCYSICVIPVAQARQPHFPLVSCLWPNERITAIDRVTQQCLLLFFLNSDFRHISCHKLGTR
jgi:hypothetical protein